jgi:hypothetical protein
MMSAVLARVDILLRPGLVDSLRCLSDPFVLVGGMVCVVVLLRAGDACIVPRLIVGDREGILALSAWFGDDRNGGR